MKKLRIFILCIYGTLFLFTRLSSLWVLNGPPTLLPPPPNYDDINIDDSIINGASDFLQSYSIVLLLLNESELSEKSRGDIVKVRELTEMAYYKLKSSRDKYEKALEIMIYSKFDNVAIERLKSLDYSGLIRKKGLHPDVMNDVSNFLCKGNIVGLYAEMLDKMNRMENIFVIIRNNIYQNVFPSLEDLRTLFQDYSDFMLIGYYTSLVFSEVKSE